MNILFYIIHIGHVHVCTIQNSYDKQQYAIKRIGKREVLKSKHRIHSIWRERNIVTNIRSPFILSANWTFQSSTDLYIVMPLMVGGDMHAYLCRYGNMHESQVKFYAAELILALSVLHSYNIVYRDMKPENILLDSTGHCMLSDFGLSCQLTEDVTGRLCIKGCAGTVGFEAPEMLQGYAYDCAIDLWSLGITLYEMLHGRLPFSDKPLAAYSNDMKEAAALKYNYFHLSSRLSGECKDFMRGLLTIDPMNRLGNKVNSGLDELMCHPWFTDIDWYALSNKSMIPPVNTSHHKSVPTPLPDAEKILSDYNRQCQNNVIEITNEQQSAFDGWEYAVRRQDTTVDCITELQQSCNISADHQLSYGRRFSQPFIDQSTYNNATIQISSRTSMKTAKSHASNTNTNRHSDSLRDHNNMTPVQQIQPYIVNTMLTSPPILSFPDRAFSSPSRFTPTGTRNISAASPWLWQQRSQQLPVGLMSPMTPIADQHRITKQSISNSEDTNNPVLFHLNSNTIG